MKFKKNYIFFQMCSNQGTANPTPEAMLSLEEKEYPVDKGKASGNFQGLAVGTNKNTNINSNQDYLNCEESNADSEEEDEDRMVICELENDGSYKPIVVLFIMSCPV